jgi:hypothetical protein
MPVKKYSESFFLSGINCPAYIDYNHNIYELELTQKIANDSLIYFLEHIQEFIIDLNLEKLIAKSIKAATKKTISKKDNFFKKRIFTFSSNFIHEFLKKFPPSSYYPILTETEIPVAITNIQVNFKYNIILKNLQTDQLVVLDIISSFDSQIKSNLNYFSAKKNLIADRLSLLYNVKEIDFFLYYIPKMKPISSNQTLNIGFKPIDTKSLFIKEYVELFLNKLKIKKNPFCLNFSCQKRKECTNG